MLSRFLHDVRARFIEDALYIAGAVIAVITAIFALGPKIAEVFNRIVQSLP
ncbi:MAG TPA: hypothetical protein G4O04_03685 [Anaerolineae bacterium]|nr:hypothetical protein [Anaerolineae bacterium]